VLRKRGHARVDEPLNFEEIYWEQDMLVAGVDEAGRGPLAGPVVAAAVVLPPFTVLDGVRDCKRLSSRRREELFEVIFEKALAVGIEVVGVDVIDKINILKASHLAMKRAFAKLRMKIDRALVDGLKIPDFPAEHEPVKHGDALCMSIAAASIIAKVIRDRIMVNYDKKFPQYGFAQHKGYGTRQHLEALLKYGPCRIHRKSFEPVKSIVNGEYEKFL